MSSCGRELTVLGGGAAVTKDKSITTLPSTNSPPNTRTQTNSTASAKAARGRLAVEPRVTRAGPRVRNLNTRCRSVDTVPSILNVACPQPSPSSISGRSSTYRARRNRTQIQADESIRVGTPRASSPNQFFAMRHFAPAHGHVHIPQLTGPRDDLIDPRSREKAEEFRKSGGEIYRPA